MRKRILNQGNDDRKNRSGKPWWHAAVLAATVVAGVILLNKADAFPQASGNEAVISENVDHMDKEPQLNEIQKSEKQENEQDNSSQNNEQDNTFQFQSKEPQIKVEVDLEVEENEQKSVDEGHSPWKLDPIFVAQVYASLLLSPEGIVGDYPIAYEDITVLENNGTAAIVEIKNAKSIAKYVYLERLIRQDDTGIWSVVGYDLN